MGYNRDGQSHHNGLKNEENSKTWLLNNNDKHNVPFLNNIKEVKKKGGTRSKDDLEIVYNNGKTLGISAKNRSKDGATHDWINSSAASILQCKTLNEVKNLQQSIRNLPLNQRESYSDHFTSFRKQKATEFIDNLSHTQINDFLNEVFLEISNQKIMVHDKKVGKIQFYDGQDHPIYEYINNSEWEFAAIRTTGRSKESAKLYAVSKSDRRKVDLNLRLRHLYNNGDSAAIGLNEGKDKNQNSSLVIKIQQESLENLYAQLQAKNKLISFLIEEK